MLGKTVLDIGCNDGRDLSHAVYANASERWGIDCDRTAIMHGKIRYPALNLVEGTAESLPFPDATFDVVTAMVSLPLTNIPKALKEIARVMRPGSFLLITLHDWKFHFHFMIEALKVRAWKRVIDLVYVTFASLVYAVCGVVLSKPWLKDGRETFQCSFRVRAQLKSCGFSDIVESREGRVFIVHAQRL